jgi:5'-nucleotidase
VGRITGAFTRSGNDTGAGRLVADAQLAATRALGAQAAFMNPGGIRANFECAAPPCTVTFGQAFTMQPFGNSLVTQNYTGAQLKAMLESQWRSRTGEPRFLQPSSTFTYTWTDAAAPGSRVSAMMLGGEPVQPDKTYRITVNSFLAEGGDGFDAIRDGQEPVGGGQDLDALLAWLGAGDRSPDQPLRINRVK